MSTPREKRNAMIMMAVCAILWSTAGLFIKFISWNPLIIAGGRSFISAIILGAFMWKRGNHLIINLYSLLAGIGLSGTCISFVVANKLTTSANAIVLQYTAPIFILLLSLILFKKKMTLSEILVVVFVTIGISLFFFDDLTPGNLVGNLFGISAGIFLALMFVSIGQVQESDSLRMSGIMIAHSLTTVIGLFALPFVSFTTNSTEIFYVLLLGVFQLGIPYVLYTLASKHCSPLTCSLIATLEPLLNPVWVFLFIGEIPGFYALIGAVIVILSISIWLVSQSRRAVN
ncbi:MAG: DMT family transporter, partial [Anaerovoracaceae bacterium]|jgi:drug/metabolite transporter (DMT)-like permease|nr:DMT family transporter [Anaerovoracaceae bacterium]